MFSFAHCLSLADAVAPQKGRNLLPVRLAVSRFTLPVREKEVLPHIVGSTSFSWTRLNGRANAVNRKAAKNRRLAVKPHAAPV